MTGHALDVHWTIPARAQQLGDTTGIVLVGLVAHGRQGCLDLPGFHAHYLETGGLKAIGQILGHGACFETKMQTFEAEAI
jgi:hypothetical protein